MWSDVFVVFSSFFWFLYRRSSAIMSWSSTHVLFWNHWGTFCAGGHPSSIFVAATAGTRTPTGSMQTTSANALTISAIPTPKSRCLNLRCPKDVLHQGQVIIQIITADQETYHRVRKPLLGRIYSAHEMCRHDVKL